MIVLCHYIIVSSQPNVENLAHFDRKAGPRARRCFYKDCVVPEATDEEALTGRPDEGQVMWSTYTIVFSLFDFVERFFGDYLSFRCHPLYL